MRQAAHPPQGRVRLTQESRAGRRIRMWGCETLRFEKTVLTIVVAVAVLVLAAPFYRGLALSQLRQAMPGRERGVWAGATDPSIPVTKTDAQLLEERPKDFALRVALAREQAGIDSDPTGIDSDQIRSGRGQNAVKALMRDYPNRGIVYVLAASLPAYANAQVPRRIEGNGITPEEAAKDWREPEPTTAAQLDGIRRSIELMDKAIAADPGNGWFRYAKAEYLYGLHRDGEALNEVHLSAVAPRFTDYTDELAAAMNHLCDLRGGFDPVRRVGRVSSICFPRLAGMRETARITAHLAYRDIRKGDSYRGIRRALDLTNAGYNMAHNAPTIIHSLVGKADSAIGARAFDPGFKPRAKGIEAQDAQRRVAYARFLLDHGREREAAVLDRQWRQTDRVLKKMRQFMRTLEADQNGMDRYYAAFEVSAGVLATILLAGLGWGAASLLTARGGARGFWDRRSAVTSALVAALVLVPLLTDLMNYHLSENMLGAMLLDEWEVNPIPLFTNLGTSAALALAALLVGLVLMLIRMPSEGENRRMPAAVLLVAYLATAGGLAYLTYRLDDFAQVTSLHASVRNNLSTVLTLFPVVAVLIYGLLRALQSRFGRVRRSAPLTFIATARYGMALAVGLFVLVYACLLPVVAHYGDRADAVARKSITQEAAFVRSAFK